MDSLLPDVAASVIVGAIMAFGLARRSVAYIRFANTLGWILLMTYAAGLLESLATLAGLVPEQSRDLRFISVVNVILWMLIAPLAWFLLRMMRLRYWQPGTAAHEGEAAGNLPVARNTSISELHRDRR